MRLKAILFYIIIILLTAISLNAGTIRIIYTANINGALENCGCGTDPLGGIGRINTFVNTYRKTNPDVLLVDGGDFFNSYPFPALDRAMLKAMTLCNYDLIIPGDQAFIDGSDFYRSIEAKMSGKVLISNRASDKDKFRKIRRGDVGIVISGFLSPAAFEFIQKPAWFHLQEPSADLVETQTGVTLRIAVFHGSRQSVEKFVPAKHKYDLILIAHEQERGIWEINGVPVVGNGKDSEYISVIEARYNKGWQIKTEQIGMSDSYPESLEILDIIDAFKVETEGM